MSLEHDPTMVGAYLLGTLEPADQAEAEAHIASCDTCRAELADLQDLPALLDQIDLSDLQEEPHADADLFGRIRTAIEDDAAQRRGHRRRLALVSAAAAVAVAGTAGGLLATAGGSAAPSFTAASGPVHMTVTLASQQTGTGLDVTVRGVPDDAHCRLVAVSRSGRTEVAGSWTASYSGTAHVSGISTSFRPSQLSQVVLQIAGTGRQVAVHTTT